ncbi:MAG: type IV pilus biogenesis/stability protein PilW [Gammaproteobacteria bacterium]
MLNFKTLILIFFLFFIVACSNVQSNTPNNMAADSNVKLGLTYLKAGESDLAKKKLLLALEENPQSSLANDAMGYFLESVGDKKAAESYYQNAIVLSNPNEKGASFNNYGTYLFRSGRAKEALKYFRLAIADPKYLQVAAAYENAGFAALALSDKNLARSYFSKSLQYDPKRIKAKQALRKLP